MDICDQIRMARRLGAVRCGVLDRCMTIIEAARAFGLLDDDGIYRLIESNEANAIGARILQADLAYGSKIMSAPRAAHLWGQFIALFAGEDPKFATNVGWSAGIWTPATQSTFDMGVLVVGVSKTGCLWVEDED
jgi:hypothetical protein